jgi:hypothetical protein
MSGHYEIRDVIETAIHNGTLEPLVRRLLAYSQHLIDSSGGDHRSAAAHQLVCQAFEEVLKGLHDHLYDPEATPFAFFGIVIKRMTARAKVKGRRALPESISGPECKSGFPVRQKRG